MKLFEREIRACLEEQDNLFKITSILHDTAHDMKIVMSVNPETMEIKDVIAEIERTPYAICEESMKSVRALIGLQIKPGINRQAREMAGGTKGCVHLIELVQECFKVAFQGQIRRIVNNLTGDERTKKLEELLDGQCMRYTHQFTSMDLAQAR